MNNFTCDEMMKKCQKLQNQLKFYQEYDVLTGIYNKETFYKKTAKLLKDDNKKVKNEQHFIVCIDVQKFKIVNNIFGTNQGNLILQCLAKELKNNIFKDSLLFSRLSADVFAACVPSKVSIDNLEEEVLIVFKSLPLDMEILPAIGVYFIDDVEMPVEKMCDNAILALNEIKGNYLKYCMVYDETLWHHIIEEQEIIGRANFALKNNEFEVYMQPKCNMVTGKIVSAEALVRWNHAEKGIISPTVFIPVFEKNGFIKKLDAYVWNRVAQWIRVRIDAGKRPIPISVNVSRVDIIGMNLIEILQDILNKNCISTEFFELEITESAYTSRLEEVIDTVEKMMSSGYTVLMDDFGSGYSSLNMLKDINVNILKLDLRFLDSTNRKSKDILESIIHMAKWLNIRVIAEGVETKSQVDFLLNIGCEYAQGFYYYKPMHIDEFSSLILDEGKIDYEDNKKAYEIKDNLIKFKDLFHADMMSEQLLNNILGGIAIYEYDGSTLRVLRYNGEYYSLINHENACIEQTGENVLDFLYEEDVLKMHEALKEAKLRGDKGTEVELRRNLTQDSFVWLQIRLFFLADTNGKSIYYAGISNITEHMNTLEKVRMSEQRFRLAMEALSSTLFELDVKTRVASFANHTKEEFGLDDCVADAPEGFIRQGSVCAAFEDDFREMYNAIYRGDDRASCVIQAHMGDDSVIWNKITLIAIKNKAGDTIKAVGLVENVTREKLLEEKLNNLNL